MLKKIRLWVMWASLCYWCIKHGEHEPAHVPAVVIIYRQKNQLVVSKKGMCGRCIVFVIYLGVWWVSMCVPVVFLAVNNYHCWNVSRLAFPIFNVSVMRAGSPIRSYTNDTYHIKQVSSPVSPYCSPITSRYSAETGYVHSDEEISIRGVTDTPINKQ